jgi:hypothetical protein
MAEERDFFARQFRAMACMLQDMQTRCESYYTQHAHRLNKIERRLLSNSGNSSSAAAVGLNYQEQFYSEEGGGCLSHTYSSISDTSDNSYEIMMGANGGATGILEEQQNNNR